MEPKAQGKIKDGRVFRREDLAQGRRRLLHDGMVNWKAASGRLKGERTHQTTFKCPGCCQARLKSDLVCNIFPFKIFLLCSCQTSCSCCRRKIRDMCLLQWYVISLSELSRTNNVCPAEIPEQLHSGCERFYGLKLLLSLLLLLLLSPRSSLRSPGQQAVGDLSSEADCQGGSARGESHVSHLRLLKRARNVQDPHQLQGGAKQLDDAHSSNCGEVPEFNQRRSQKKKLLSFRVCTEALLQKKVLTNVRLKI